MAISDWDAADLCLDSDCTDIEQRAQAYAQTRGSLKKWRVEAKDIIGERIKYAMRQEDRDATSSILDLIEDLTVLKRAAIHLTLHLLFNDLIASPGDLYEEKAAYHLARYEDELPRALAMVSLDLDESGAIDTGEEFNMRQGVRMSR